MKVIGTVVQANDPNESNQWVVGLIATNPFYRKRNLPKELDLDGAALQDLLQMQLLLVDLQDHIEVGDEVDAFFLYGVETTDIADASAIRAFGSWGNIVKRRRDNERWQRSLELEASAVIKEVAMKEKRIDCCRQTTGRRAKVLAEIGAHLPMGTISGSASGPRPILLIGSQFGSRKLIGCISV